MTEDYWVRDRITRKRLRDNPIWFRLHWTKTGRTGVWHRVITEITPTWMPGNIGRCDCGVCTSWIRGRDHVEVEFTHEEPTPLCAYARKDKLTPTVDVINPYQAEIGS